jgi:hypothetical protein
MIERRGSGYPGHVERLPDASIEHSVEEDVRVVRLGAPAQPRVDADVRQAVERHRAEPPQQGVAVIGPRVERIESEERDRLTGNPSRVEVRIR